jgi:nucleoside diphosphate kinase
MIPTPYSVAPFGGLTKNRRKAELYALDPSFLELYDQLNSRFADPAAAVRPVALLMLKPEAIRRKVSAIVGQFLATHQVEILAAAPVMLTASTCHLLWRYQWTRATPDRTRLHCLMGESGPSLVLVCRGLPDGIPTSVRLWGLKGSTDSARRTSGQLREQIGMSNRMIAFVHCADEPADVVRDLAILWPNDRRDTLLSVLEPSGRHGVGLIEQAKHLEDSVSSHEVDVLAACQRLGSSAGNTRLREAVQNRDRWRLDDVMMAFGPVPDETAVWDRLVIAADLIHHDIPGLDPIISPDDYGVMVDAWTA